MSVIEQLDWVLGCGANAPGGGGFQSGNTCARGGDDQEDSPWKDWKPNDISDNDWEVKETEGAYGSFTTDKGQIITIEMSNEGLHPGLGTVEWRQKIMDIAPVDYYDQPDEFVEYSFSGEEGYELSGKGEAMAIMRRAAKNLISYIDQYAPVVITYSADNNEPSRIRLYKFLTRNITKLLPEYKAMKPSKGKRATAFALVARN